ncbi:ScyD/ScyE family protein [Nocardioides aquiterrae]
MRRTPLIPVAVAALSLLATALAPAANAADGTLVADGLVSPLKVAVATDGTVYVTQNFAGLLTEVAPGGDPEVIYADEAHREIGGVSVSGDVVTFTATGGPTDAAVYTYTPNGDGWDQAEIADTGLYEKTHNPDGTRTYGIRGLSKACKRSIPKDNREGMVAYGGIKDSHPYATTTVGDTTYVADAAGNDILAVGPGGEISTLALLPPVKATVTKKLRKGWGLPKCTQGKTFKGEPVPTDIEVGPDGNLYVTTLGGRLGEVAPVGSVYQVALATGTVTLMKGGLYTPTGIAISPTGTAYISLLFPGVVMQQPLGGDASPLAEVPYAADVEYGTGGVYVTSADLEGDPADPHGQVLLFPAGG